MFKRVLSKIVADYGMPVVLVLLCVYYSLATIESRRPGGAAGARDVVKQAHEMHPAARSPLIIAGEGDDDRRFVDEAKRLFAGTGSTPVVVTGDPQKVRRGLSGQTPDLIVATAGCEAWLGPVLAKLPAVANVPVLVPVSHRSPTFLNPDNLLNVANQIVVIAVIAVGMTMVIITGGIDLSVGSLLALSAVVTGILIRDHAGGLHASTTGLILCSLAGIAAAGAVGAFSGAMITFFRVPPFIATLAVMQIANGRAYTLIEGQSIDAIPDAFTWLGRGFGFLGLPNGVWLMLVVFLLAYVAMSRTRFGRYIYAVGGNIEAARLSGVNTGLVLMIVYTLSGLAAGLGGVIFASTLKSSSASFGLGYELNAIAAVVVGGTSLAGGEGKIFGTFVGVLIIAVIQNGMNLTGVGPFPQKEVLGWVILGAVLLDNVKRQSWRMPPWLRLGSGKVAAESVRPTATEDGNPTIQ